MSRLAAIDIGSNAIRLLIAEVENNKLTVLEDRREALRLGMEVFLNGVISKRSIDKASEVVSRLKLIAKRQGALLLRVVATSAVREARNREHFIKRVESTSKTRVQVISGLDEAKLIKLAVCQKLGFKRQSALLIDIGGGSVEFTLIGGKSECNSVSLKIGAVRLLAKYGDSKIGMRRMKEHIDKQLKQLHARFKAELRKKKKFTWCIGSGGSVESLLKLGNRKKKGLKKSISAAELKRLAHTLQKLNCENRMRVFKLKADRADVILPAAVILLASLRRFNISKLLVPKVGLKEGVLLDLASSFVKL